MRKRVRFAFVLGIALVPAAARADDDSWVLNDSNAKVTHDCGKQPKVAINASTDEITLTGKCAKVSLNGGNIKLTAESIDALAVNGAENTIDVGAVGKIALTGAENKVTWKTALAGKKPKVSDLGNGNSVTQAK